jgi:hypothetical protein
MMIDTPFRSNGMFGNARMYLHTETIKALGIESIALGDVDLYKNELLNLNYNPNIVSITLKQMSDAIDLSTFPNLQSLTVGDSPGVDKSYELIRQISNLIHLEELIVNHHFSMSFLRAVLNTPYHYIKKIIVYERDPQFIYSADAIRNIQYAPVKLEKFHYNTESAFLDVHVHEDISEVFYNSIYAHIDTIKSTQFITLCSGRTSTEELKRFIMSAKNLEHLGLHCIRHGDYVHSLEVIKIIENTLRSVQSSLRSFYFRLSYGITQVDADVVSNLVLNTRSLREVTLEFDEVRGLYGLQKIASIMHVIPFSTVEVFNVVLRVKRVSREEQRNGILTGVSICRSFWKSVSLFGNIKRNFTMNGYTPSQIREIVKNSEWECDLVYDYYLHGLYFVIGKPLTFK